MVYIYKQIPMGNAHLQEIVLYFTRSQLKEIEANAKTNCSATGKKRRGFEEEKNGEFQT